jgi:hypothetical protein
MKCGKTIEVNPDAVNECPWFCDAKTKHVVEKKEYFIEDTIGGHTYITNVPPSLPATQVDGSSDEHVHEGRSVLFVDGRYETSDPERQFWLDMKGGFIAEQEWQRQRMTPQQIQLAELERNRKEMEELRAQLAR